MGHRSSRAYRDPGSRPALALTADIGHGRSRTSRRGIDYLNAETAGGHGELIVMGQHDDRIPLTMEHESRSQMNGIKGLKRISKSAGVPHNLAVDINKMDFIEKHTGALRSIRWRDAALGDADQFYFQKDRRHQFGFRDLLDQKTLDRITSFLIQKR